MNNYRVELYRLKGKLMLLGLVCLLLACRFVGSGTAIPPGRPASFDVQTPSPTDDRLTATPIAVNESVPAEIIPLGDAPTHTPTPIVPPTDTPPPPTLAPTEETILVAPTVEPTTEPVIEPTAEAAADLAPPPPPPAAVELDPPRQGGDWDFEAEYIPWGNPYGEPCPGASVAAGWTAFAEQGEFGSSCFNENLYQPNVQAGAKSQEITFDFIAANSGLWRIVESQPGHRYTVTAYAKSDPSLAPVQMYLGFDFNGGTVWDAAGVEWFPWQQNTQDEWGQIEETVTATGNSFTLFIRGWHPMADQGGKTVVDNVTVTHLGP